MASKTTNYKLNKIDLKDAPPDITVLNQNWDILDEELQNVRSRTIGLNGSVANINNAIKTINGELDGVNGRLNTIDGNISTINGELDGVNGRLNTIDGNISTINGELDGVNGNINTINDNINTINGELDTLNGKVDNLGSGVTGKGSRIPVNGWELASDGSYYNNVTVLGLTTENQVIVDCRLNGADIDGDIAVMEAWSCVNRAEQGDEELIFYCYGDKPTIAIPINVVVM